MDTFAEEARGRITEFSVQNLVRAMATSKQVPFSAHVVCGDLF